MVVFFLGVRTRTASCTWSSGTPCQGAGWSYARHLAPSPLTIQLRCSVQRMAATTLRATWAHFLWPLSAVKKTRMMKLRMKKARMMKLRMKKARMMKLRMKKARMMKLRMKKARMMKLRMKKTRMMSEDDEIEIINYHQDKSVLRAYVYSSETQECTSPASIRIGSVEAFGADLAGKPSVLVGQALHYLFTGREHGFGILKYDLAEHSLSTIGLPGLCVYNPLLVLADDGGLTVVHLDKHDLCIMWSMEVNLDGVVSWIQLREMDLNMLLPVGHPSNGHRAELVGYVEGTEIIIAATNIGAFTIDLKSLRLRELVSKKFGYHGGLCDAIFLYMSFSNPPGVLDDARARASKLPPYRKMPTANFSRARARASKLIFF